MIDFAEAAKLVENKDKAGLMALVDKAIAAGEDLDASDCNNDTLLIFAAKCPSALQSIRRLIDAGADVRMRNIEGRTALNHSLGNSPQSVSALLAAGADPNAKDRNGETPLHWGACSAATVRIMLSYGADPRAVNDFGCTPLHMAALYCPAAVPILTDAGADVDAQDSNGTTALMEAAMKPNIKSLRLLLHRGADIFISDGLGRTVFDMIQEGFVEQRCASLLFAARDRRVKKERAERESGGAPCADFEI